MLVRPLTQAVALSVIFTGAAPTPSAAAEAPFFEDVTTEWGVDFRHFNGMIGKLYFPEMTGQGGALFDYDGDGDLDLYFRQGDLLGAGDLDEALVFPKPQVSGDRLFRHDWVTDRHGRMAPRFVDWTEQTGIEGTGYGMGIAVGDYDQDGALDLYLTNYGSNQLWHSRGDGSFEDRTKAAGVQDTHWSTSAAFVDIDGDLNPDLFAVNYIDFDVARNPACYAESSARDYCGPSAFRPQSDRVWRNRGDGTFEDITARSSVGLKADPGLGIATGDFNGDGRIDVYVANDGSANHLWLGAEKGRFVEDGLFSGTALNRAGAAEASMGISVDDFDNDGDEDLFLTHLTLESNTLYRNAGEGLFDDHSIASGLGAASLQFTGFGTGSLDFDNDGWVDLAIANGAVKQQLEQVARGDLYPLRQLNQLFRNVDGQSFEVVPGLDPERVSRGVATGDIDNDGATDFVVFNNSDRPSVLRNTSQDSRPHNGWIGLAGRLAPLSRARLETQSGRSLHRVSRREGSYCSASDHRIVLGLGRETPVSLLLEKLRGIKLVDPPADSYLVFPF